jgi:hypothetical protein
MLCHTNLYLDYFESMQKNVKAALVMIDYDKLPLNFARQGIGHTSKNMNKE